MTEVYQQGADVQSTYNQSARAEPYNDEDVDKELDWLIGSEPQASWFEDVFGCPLPDPQIRPFWQVKTTLATAEC